MKRHVPLAGQPNFRDLGGYATADGRKVRWGRVFRSGELSQLTDDDVAVLGELGIKTVVDLRSPEEVQARGESRAPEGATTVRLPIASGDMFSKVVPMLLEGDFSQLPENLLERVNRALVRDCAVQYGDLLRTLLDASNRPLVFHCTQGKDRAGFGAAMVLSALGVSWEVVVEDYLLSNVYRKQDNEKMLGMVRQFAGGRNGQTVDVSKIEALLVVKPDSIHAAHAEIRSRHGDMHTFLTGALGLGGESLDELREHLLE
ncbi:MAG: tyrosine-protein phosphatase [Myxococcota bacterium]